MRFRSSVSKTLALSALAYVAACGGDSSGPATSVPTTVTITSSAIALTEIGQTATVTATVLDQNGAEIPDASLTFSSSNASVATVSGAGVVTAAGDGSATITVSAGTASANTTATVRISTLTIGQPLTGISLIDGTERLFEVDVPAGSTAGRILEFALAGSTGDADLIVRRGAAPSPPADFDCLSLSAESSETCAFVNAQDGRWFVLVQAFSGGGNVTGLTLTPRLVDFVTATDGAPVQGLSATANTFAYVTLDVPAGSGAPPEANRVVVGDRVVGKEDVGFEVSPEVRAVVSSEGPEPNTPATLTVTLAGGSGDADLLGLPGTLWSRTNVEAPPCVSQLDGNAEQCLVETPAGGPWIFAVFGFQSFNGVTFTADYDAGVVLDPGTITIQKTVTAFDGGTANNPANPSLAGFEFEIRPAGGGEVVTTVTTDASGAAIATVPPGTYDVVESDARGLTDFTSSANGIVVAEAANSAVAWENRQVDPNAGTITIIKTVTSSTGGTADNPANPGLAGFEFEVRPAGGGAVVATVTTDSAGSAVATVSPGSYDITESNAQGLTNFTSAVDAVPVSALTNTNVPWQNRQEDPAANQDPVVSVFAGPAAVASSDGNSTIVYFNAGNSTDPDGDPLTYAWTSTTGTFLGGTTGAFTRATFPSAPATVTVTVDDGRGGVVAQQVSVPSAPLLPSAGTYNIELVNVSTPPPSVQTALNLAVDTWERVIRNELTDISFSTPVAEGTCFDSQPVINDVVDDIRIYVDIDSIDGPGSVLGRAGPCFSRNSDGTIILGFMQFDSQDLENLSTNVLNAVILHEMAHVFGIGTLWPGRGLLENPSCSGGCTSASPSPDTRYIGTDGSAAWLAFGGLLADGGAPVENGEGVNAGQGTRDGHWREISLRTELMTGFVGQSANPLSLITLAALEDVGLDLIDYSQADDFVVPTLTPAPGLAAARLGGGDGTRGVHLHGDAYLGPIRVVDEEGNVVGVIPPSR